MTKQPTALTRRMSVTAEEAAHIYFMAHLVKTALLAPPPEVSQIATKLQQRVIKLYPELKGMLEK